MTTEGSIGGMGSGTGSGMGTTDSSLVNRMIRAARLDTNLYEEVEADRTATTQAAIVVAIGAVSAAVGIVLRLAMLPGPDPNLVGAVIGGVLAALIGWVVWSYLTYFVGTAVFGGTATPGEMLRTIGFAQSPRVLTILTFPPILGDLLDVALWVWVVVAGVVAVRQALDIDTGKAIATTLIAAVPYLIARGLLRLLIGG